MAKKVYFDAGHGGDDPGAVKYVREADVAKKVVQAACSYLKKTYTCDIYEDITADSTQTISARANKWKADLFVSVHFNAGGGDGYECYLYSEANKALGRCFESHVKSIGQNVRGVKYDPSLNVLRLTDMPAILNEIAFVDSKKDIADWDEAAELTKMGQALAKAAADWLDLPKKAAAKGDKYRTTTGMNFRKSPSTTAAKLGVIPKGTTLTGTVDANGWLKTTYKGKTGYIRQKVTKVYCKKL